ncbi:MAG: NAD-dependent epimerase/dehydratase family protein, partial [Bacteroidales bacterium]|nr:NAD-dependent epimerase/dehydratase family protein [Bacteroidales bacterium]
MKKILVLGSGGQIGSELTMRLREVYGGANVVATDLNPERLTSEIQQTGPTGKIDACDAKQIAETVKKYDIDAIYNLVAILSATAEKNPMLGWNVGMGALINCLEIAREHKCALFTPSSIGAFGPNTPLNGTPQDTIQRPGTIYGVTKVTGEL